MKIDKEGMMGVIPTIRLYKLIKEGRLIIEPFELREELTPPATIDLSLKGKVIKYNFKSYILGEDIPPEEKEFLNIENGTYKLAPGESVLLPTYEKIGLSSTIAGLIMPRSSLTRLGIVIQPIYLNPGYVGHCPVLIVNHASFEIEIPFKNGKSPRLLQVMFFELTEEPHRTYGKGTDEKYYKEEGKHSEIYKDFDIYELLSPLAEIAEKYE